MPDTDIVVGGKRDLEQRNTKMNQEALHYKLR